MGEIVGSPPVKRIVALMLTPDRKPESALEILEREWGKTDLSLGWYEFNHSDYYRDEFGEGLKKNFFSFESLIPIEIVPEIKRQTNQWEELFLLNGKRTVNIDPGYLADAKLVMPTTKNLSHRIYIGQGIYADQQLMYYGGTFHPMPWTFADYRREEVIDFFNRVRRMYFDQLRKMGWLDGRK